MKKAILIPFFIFFISNLFCQTDSLSNDTKFAFGIEGGAVLHSFKSKVRRGFRKSYGVTISYPIRKFSLELAFLKRDYGLTYFDEYVSRISRTNLRGRNAYYYEKKEFELDYLVISNRLQYRLPCNCVYFQVSSDIEFATSTNYLDGHSWYTQKTYTEPESTDEKVALKKVNTSFAFAVGFKLHFTETFRIIMVPSYSLTNKFSSSVNSDAGNSNFFWLSFGIQKGIKGKLKEKTSD